MALELYPNLTPTAFFAAHGPAEGSMPAKASYGRLFAREEIDPPVVAPHGVTLGILKLALFDESEAEPAAQRVRWEVLHGGEGVQIAVQPARPGQLDGLRRAHGRQTTPLEGGEHTPASLVHLLA